MKNKTRSLNLISGGLDSLLAACVLKSQGVDVTGITFVTPFFGSANAERGTAQIGIPLIIVDITDEHLKMVKRPKHGYGKAMNPCIDCHAMMLCRAGEKMKEMGFDLLATGEVLGERPMSQNMQALGTVARDSGFADLILRPLSAKLLPPTKPEREGLVHREKLFGISGRSRKPQMELAKELGIKSYVQPAGGCLLTDQNFSKKLSELFTKDPETDAHNVRLLKLGRHFRLPSGVKAIVGRNEKDNNKIEKEMKIGRALLFPETIPGPTILLVGRYDDDDLKITADICAGYSDHNSREVDVEAKTEEGKKVFRASPRPRGEFEGMKIQ